MEEVPVEICSLLGLEELILDGNAFAYLPPQPFREVPHSLTHALPPLSLSRSLPFLISLGLSLSPSFLLSLSLLLSLSHTLSHLVS